LFGGKQHDYLAMILDYSVNGVLKVGMRYYVDAMIKDFLYELIGCWTMD